MNDAAGETVGEYVDHIDANGNGNGNGNDKLRLSNANTSGYDESSLRNAGNYGRLNSSDLGRRTSLGTAASAAGGSPPGAGGTADDNDLLPSRWWFAASAFPMAAGTLGPVASAFSICALVRPWRQVIRPGQTIETAAFIADPIWLTTINAVQLAIALIANVFLLLNMARRIRFAVAQPITMVGWYISSLTLISLSATAAGPLARGNHGDGDMVWSQAFYYGIFSALLYMIVASLMVVTFLGAWTGHYAKDFQLTNSQRTLMLQTIMFLMYLLVGALIFSTIEGWAFLDAVYWADVTLFTIGFGDLAAETTLGRALLFPYALIGIISLGLVIGSIRSLALERGKHRLVARITEKNRRKVLDRLAKKGRDAILQPIQAGGGSSHDGAAAQQHDGTADRASSSSLAAAAATNAALGLTEYERREEEFNIMRKIQHDAARKRRWMSVSTSGGTWLVLWLLGAYIFQVCESPYQHWNYFDGFYLAFVSLTTMGYGDLTPVSNAGRSFFVFWSLLALPTTTVLISDAGDTIVKAVSDATDAIGRITILPGERGLKRDLKGVLRAMTFGAVFSDVDVEDIPPGLLGAAQQTSSERNASLEEAAEEDAEEAEAVIDSVESEFRRQHRRDHDSDDDNRRSNAPASSSTSDDMSEKNVSLATQAGQTAYGQTTDGTQTGNSNGDGDGDGDGENNNENNYDDDSNNNTNNDDDNNNNNINNDNDGDGDNNNNSHLAHGYPSTVSMFESGSSKQPYLKHPNASMADVMVRTSGAASLSSASGGNSGRRRYLHDLPEQQKEGQQQQHQHQNQRHHGGNDHKRPWHRHRVRGTSTWSATGAASSASSASAVSASASGKGTALGGIPDGSKPMRRTLSNLSTMSMPRTDFPQEMPATRSAYHCVLMDEITRVTQHLRHTPPRKYTFPEWAWFLKLLGEDEHNAQTHQRVKTGRAKNDAAVDDGGEPGHIPAGSDHDGSGSSGRTQWSWVGARSPLMGSKEEAEWILDKLMKRLQAELHAADMDSRESLGRGDSGGDDAVSSSSRGDGLSMRALDPASLTSVRRHTHSIQEEPSG